MVDADEIHGRAMLTLGAMDLRLAKIFWRLIEPGDYVADIGAKLIMSIHKQFSLA